MTSIKVALIQVDSGDSKELNFQNTRKYISDAVKMAPDIICLPEVFLYQGDDKQNAGEELSSPYIQSFRHFARENNVNIILGSIALKTSTAKMTNSTLVINRVGEIIHRYNKMYMYDVKRDDMTYRESDTFAAGKDIGYFELDGVKMGVGICVDLRYPEYFREIVQRGTEIIFLPSSFRKVTGQIAWDVLTRARAIENQVYFCACGQTGGIGVKERCGNSRIVSFDGRIISESGQEVGIIYADLDLDALRKFREAFPVLDQMK